MAGPIAPTQGAGALPQRQLPDSCELCGGTDLRNELVRSAFWHEDRLVVVEDIPAVVCGSCHEQFYDDLTVIQIDLLRGDGFPAEQAGGEIRAPVFSLRDQTRGNGEPQ
ncbi:MAG: YgiT-type zinc finger protein [Alphaproteobacteria bacterium]|nr:YgiT-type zinc finger protein [Alphaproteobacteria bacterium]